MPFPNPSSACRRLFWAVVVLSVSLAEPPGYAGVALNPLYSFPGVIGSGPYGIVQGTDGNLYGVAGSEGPYDSGTIFQTPNGNLVTLYAFTTGLDGAFPQAALTEDADGNSYGSAVAGGLYKCGARFRISPTGQFTTLLVFNGANGSNPTAPLVLGMDGNFYGTTSGGGASSNGAIFCFPPDGAISNLFSFNATNGAGPDSPLVIDAGGNFYGVTFGGGPANDGTIFELAIIGPSGVVWNPIRVGSYGPVANYHPPLEGPGTPLADTLVWRSRALDPPGYYCLGARYYDPVAGHFLSPDPLGHSASMDLYSFCSGDPLNQFDPDGRFGKGANAGVNDGGVPSSASSAYMAGYLLGGITSAFSQGANEGAAITANIATLGLNDDLSAHANSLQGSVYDYSRGFATVGVAAAYLATGRAAYSSAGLYAAAGGISTYASSPSYISEAQQEAGPAAEETAGQTVFSGHGALVVGDSSPVTALPQGTSLTFWTEHGNSISDALGNAIETGGQITVEQFPEAAGARSYLPGSFVPNYTLYPPTGLNIMGNPLTVTSPTSLSSLLQPGMGSVNWAACRSIIAP